MIPALYHWTCEHGFRQIGGRGILLPGAAHSPTQRDSLRTAGRAVAFQTSVVWLTDLASANRRNAEALGLTRHLTHCDRMAHRYRTLDPSSARPWMELRDTWPGDIVQQLESAPGVQPEHWWCAHAIEAEMDR